MPSMTTATEQDRQLARELVDKARIGNPGRASHIGSSSRGYVGNRGSPGNGGGGVNDV